MKNFRIVFILFVAVFAAACTENKTPQSIGDTGSIGRIAAKTAGVDYQNGDVVPHDEVCMVNDAFMGKKQIEVVHNSKKYYGCCEMCKKRIPKEEAIRMAVDPVSQNQVDKAAAIIAITGDNGEVAYFENDANYKAFFKQKK